MAELIQLVQMVEGMYNIYGQPLVFEAISVFNYYGIHIASQLQLIINYSQGQLHAGTLYMQIAEHLEKILIEKRITFIRTADFLMLEGKEDNDVWNGDQLNVLKVGS